MRNQVPLWTLWTEFGSRCLSRLHWFSNSIDFDLAGDAAVIFPQCLTALWVQVKVGAFGGLCLILRSTEWSSAFGGLAQLGERLTGSQKVTGSIPVSSTKISVLFAGRFFYCWILESPSSFLGFRG
jgi:hypothetical protein